MNVVNKAVACIFAFKETGGKDMLSLFVIDGGDDSFELPSAVMTEGDADLRSALRRALLVDPEKGRIALRPEQLVAVSTIDRGREIITSYVAFLQQWPGRPRGTSWLSVVDGNVDWAELSESHRDVLSDVISHLRISLLVPDSRFPVQEGEMLKKVWDFLMPKGDRASFLEAVSRLANGGNSGTGLSCVSSTAMAEALAARPRLTGDWRKDAELRKDVPEEKRGKYVYDYFHPCLTVDIVILAINEEGRYVVPLTLSTGTDKKDGKWSLPGGFVQADDYKEAGWEPGRPFDFDKRPKEEYLDYIKRGRSVVEVAARRIIKEKTGIELDEDAVLYPLSTPVQDNPCHGWVDGAPIISRSFFTVVRDYRRFEGKGTNVYVESMQWFPIHRRLFKEDAEGNGVMIVEEGGKVNGAVAEIIDGKEDARGENRYRLSYNQEWTDMYLTTGKDASLVIDYSQDSEVTREERKVKDRQEKGQVLEILGHHGFVIAEALEVVKDKVFTSTILADFMVKNPDMKAWRSDVNKYKFVQFNTIRDTLKGFAPSSRQALNDKIVVKCDRVAEWEQKMKKARTEAERMKLRGRRWTDPQTGDEYIIYNNGFLWKDEDQARSYYVNVPFLERFLERGSTI